MARKKKKIKNRYKSRYQAGGMYGSNTVSAAGQGTPTNTANIVYAESNPAILEQNLKAEEANKLALMNQSESMSSKIKQMDEQSEIDIQQAADKVQAKGQMVDSGVKTGMELAKKSGVLDNAKTTGSGLKDALNVYRMQRAANLAGKAQVGIKAGVQTLKQAQQGTKAIAMATKATTSSGIPATIAAPQTTAALAEGAKGVGSSIGASLSSAATNPNVIALAANVGGKLIKKKFDDDDATTWTAGEATGDILSSAGKYAGYGATIGSIVPGVGTGIGAGLGAIYGAGKSIWTNLTGKNEANRVEAKNKVVRDNAINKYNKDLTTSMLSKKIQSKQALLKSKRYSGYDLGRNVMAQTGGMRMGMPRYGYAA